jgi:hypothetical protein
MKVVVVSYGYWLVGYRQTVHGRGKPLPFCRSWILVLIVACVVATIAGFGVVDVAANLSLVLLSQFLWLLAVAAAALRHQLYRYLLSLLLALCLLSVLTAKWRATVELLRSDETRPTLRVPQLSRVTVNECGANSLAPSKPVECLSS